MLDIAYILFYFSYFSILIPIFFLLGRKQNFKIILIRVLGILLFASALSDLGGYILISMGKSNILIANIYSVVQFFLLSIIYYLLLEKKKIVYIASILFSLFFILNASFIQPFNEFQSWPLVLESIIFIIFSIIYYGQMLKSKPLIDFVIFYRFWLNSALFLYFAFNLYIFALSNYIFKNMEAEVGIITWSFHNINNIGKNIIFALAIYCVKMKGRIYDLST
jgi:hypothetical protein